jgi:hypothetical protein
MRCKSKRRDRGPTKSERNDRAEIEAAKEQLELASARALAFVAAALGPVPACTIEVQDPWRLALLRMVNCLDLGPPKLAHQILVQALSGENPQ